MPSISSALLVICITVALSTTALASPILNDLFHGFVHESQIANEPPKDRAVVKRRIYPENPDANLKQISLQSLIGDVEDSLYQTALSVSSVAYNNDDMVPEVKPNSKIDNKDSSIIKRQTEETTENNANDESKSILLQTTQKIPAVNGFPSHILIDRVAVHSHQGGVPIIPAFQVYHTKVMSATFKESPSSTNGPNDSGNVSNGSTKPSIALNAVKETNADVVVPAINSATINSYSYQPTIKPITDGSTLTTRTLDITTESIHSVQNIQEKTDQAASTSSKPVITISSSTDSVGVTEKIMAAPPTTSTTPSTTTPTTTTTIPTTTTKLPIDQLKEAEEELKEKVAEIEAEPVILTARV